MKHNPDDRRDNTDKIQYNIDMTIRNMQLADEMIAKTSDETLKRELIAKNYRRREALRGMRHEIKEEAEARRREGETS